MLIQCFMLSIANKYLFIYLRLDEQFLDSYSFFFALIKHFENERIVLL